MQQRLPNNGSLVNSCNYWLAICALFLRLCLAAGFLSSVADSIGLYGPYGTPNVSWGNFQNFIDFTQQLISYLPMDWVPIHALLATIAEVIISVFLLIGLWTRFTSIAAGILLIWFAIILAIALGIKVPLDNSVFAAAGGAFLLSLTGPGKWSIDYALKSRFRFEK